MLVEDFIADLDEVNRDLCFQLHDFLVQSVPNVNYCIKWGVPFYYYYGNLCYINPKKHYLILGFYQGAKLANQSGILKGQGALVRHVIIKSLEDIYRASLLEVVQEAIILDELHYGKKRKK